MAIRNFLDISTAHVTKSDSLILDNRACPFRTKYENAIIVMQNGEYGWFVHVPADTEFEHATSQMRRAGLSEPFINVLKYARSLNCDYILFDRDADTVSDLENFDW